MNSFLNYFALYESTDPPPIKTDGYKQVQDTYFNYLDTLPLFLEEKPSKLETKYPEIRAIYSLSNPIQEAVLSRILSFNNKEDYVRTMYNPIHQALENNGLDADKWTPILIAQTALESGWGNSFSRRTNNYGGIKGKGSGKVLTKEYDPKKGYYTIQDEFKSYPTIDAFADDYVKLLKDKFNAFKGDISDYVYNIRSKGYFTAPLNLYLSSINSILKLVNLYLS